MKVLITLLWLLLIDQYYSIRFQTHCSNSENFYYMGSYDNNNYWLCHTGFQINIKCENSLVSDQCSLNNIQSIRGYIIDSLTYIFIDQDKTYMRCGNSIINQFENIKSLCSTYKSNLYCLIENGSKLRLSKLENIGGVYTETIHNLSNMDYPSSASMLFKAITDEKYLICYLKVSKTYCGFEYFNSNDVYHYCIKFAFTKLQNFHIEEDESILITGLTIENGIEINVVVLINNKWEANVIWRNPNSKQEDVFISNNVRNIDRLYYHFFDGNDGFLDYYDMYRCDNINYGSKNAIAFTLNRIILVNNDQLKIDFYFDETDLNNQLMIDGNPVQKNTKYTTDQEIALDIQSNELKYRYHLETSQEICSINIVQCLSNCESCWGKGNSSDHKCFFCSNGYKSGTQYGNCEADTDEKYFNNILENTRDRCPSNCNRCQLDSNDNIIKCLTCKPSKPYLTQDGNCLSKCPNGVSSTNECNRVCPGNQAGNPCQNCVLPNDKFYEEVCYEKCPINTYNYLNKCYMKCPLGTYVNIIDRTCIPCSSPLDLYSKNHCIFSCPEGYVAQSNICKKCNKYYHNNICVEQCPPIALQSPLLDWDNLSAICKECKGFYDTSFNECVYKCSNDYNQFNQCVSKIPFRIIDNDYTINLNHNPSPELENVMKDSFDNASKNDKEAIINDVYQLIMNHNNDVTHYEETSDKISYIVLYFQLIASSVIENNDQQSKRSHDIYNKLLSILASSEGSNISQYLADNMAIISLGILYSTLNKKSKPDSSYKTLNELISVFFNKNYKAFLLSSNQDKIKQGAVYNYNNDLLMGMAYTLSKQIDMLYNLPNPSFGQSQLENEGDKISHALLTTQSHIKFKEILDALAQYSIHHQNWLSINTPNYLIRNSPIDLTTSSKWFVRSDCSSDYKSSITQMKEGNMPKLICLPSNLISTNPSLESGTIGIINYQLYPLVNKQVPLVTKDFISLRLFTKGNEIVPLKGLSENITIILLKSNASYNECIFFNEEEKTINNTDCKSENIDDYLICSCNHLTDFAGSIFNPVNVYNDVVKLFQQSRFITSFEAFKYLNTENAVVVYVFSGIVFLYLIGLVITMKYDVKNEDDCFIIIVDKTPKCCSNEEIEEEIEILRTKTASQIMERKNVIVHKFLGGNMKKKLNLAILSNLKIAIEEPPQENIKPDSPTNMSQVINNNSSQDRSNETINNNSSTSSIRQSNIQSNQGISQPNSLPSSQANSRSNTPNNASAPPQVIPGSSSSVSVSISSDQKSSKQSEENKNLNKHCILRYIYLFKEFFLNEYRVCLLIFNKEHVYTRSDVLTMIAIKLIAMLTICGIFTQCKPIGVENEEDDGFTSRMLAVGIGTIITLEIPFTICEVLLLKHKLPMNKRNKKEKIRKSAIVTHICVYVFFVFVFVFGFINTTWVSLDSYHNKLSCDYMQDFMLSTALDYLVYDVVVIVMKAFIYSFLIRADKKTYCQICLISFISTLPWLFAMQG